MSDKPKRPWFRFHLLTAVLMMFAAGAMIWPNFVPNLQFQYVHYKYKSKFARYYGWPASFAWHSYAAVITDDGKIVKGEARPMELNWIPGLIIDAAFYAAVLGGIAYFSESLIRRREARKP